MVWLSTLNMPTSPFPSLPAELICQIFELSDSFSEVFALAQTARLFYDTWRTHATLIYQAVAPRTLTNLADAERLRDIQEASAAQEPEFPTTNGAVRIQKMLLNARCAPAVFEELMVMYKVNAILGRGKDAPKRTSEFLRFEHAFYCVWMVGTLVLLMHDCPRRMHRIVFALNAYPYFRHHGNYAAP